MPKTRTILKPMGGFLPIIQVNPEPEKKLDVRGLASGTNIVSIANIMNRKKMESIIGSENEDE